MADGHPLSGNVHPVGDVRRLVAQRGFGAYRLLYVLHAIVEDVHGAVDGGQLDTAASLARSVVVESLAIRGLAATGDVGGRGFNVAADPFEGIDEDEAAAALELAARGLDLDAGDGDAVRAWLAELDAHVAETEARLDLGRTLPSIRTPSGLFPAIRFAREWMPVMEAVHLPSMLPQEWVPPDSVPDG